jgi:tetratricopeptide (TPR) repeat protein
VVAAEQALAGNDFADAVARVDRGIAAGAHGGMLGELSVILGEAARWLGDLERAYSALTEALALLPRGARAWCVAAREQAVVLQRTSRKQEAEQLCEELLQVTRPPDADAEASTELAHARIRAAMAISYLGNSELSRRLIATVEQNTPHDILSLPVVEAWLHRQLADEAARRGDFALFLDHTERAVARFRSGGVERLAVSETGTGGYALVDLGEHDRALIVLAQAEAAATRLGMAQPAAVARQNLAMVLACLGRLTAASATESRAISTFAALGERRWGASRTHLR